MTTQQSVDQAKTEAFLGKVLSDTSGMTTTIIWWTPLSRH
jgi:hypothetical protein